MSGIDVRGVTKRFRGADKTPVTVLDDIKLEVREGEFVVLLGPSGCGKTTLLRIMGQLETPSEGGVYFVDQSSDGPASDKSDKAIGFVFQEATLMPWRTALDNVALPLETAHVPKKQRAERSREMLKLVGLADAEHKYPRQLSGGMRQRVSIARALAHDPKVLLMDEPFGALDAQTRDMMNLELQRIWMRARKTVVFVTHSVPEAVFLADRIVMLSTHPGRIHTITEVNIPRERTLEDMESPEFREIAGDLRDQLRDIQAGKAAKTEEAS